MPAKTAVISGGAGGIGQAVVLRFGLGRFLPCDPGEKMKARAATLSRNYGKSRLVAIFHVAPGRCKS